jgi:hypothetical protein
MPIGAMSDQSDTGGSFVLSYTPLALKAALETQQRICSWQIVLTRGALAYVANLVTSIGQLLHVFHNGSKGVKGHNARGIKTKMITL